MSQPNIMVLVPAAIQQEVCLHSYHIDVAQTGVFKNKTVLGMSDLCE